MPVRPHARYVVDAKGRRREVVLSVKDFRAMLQELEDLRDAQYVDQAEASAEGFIGLDEPKKSLAQGQP